MLQVQFISATTRYFRNSTNRIHYETWFFSLILFFRVYGTRKETIRSPYRYYITVKYSYRFHRRNPAHVEMSDERYSLFCPTVYNNRCCAVIPFENRFFTIFSGFNYNITLFFFTKLSKTYNIMLCEFTFRLLRQNRFAKKRCRQNCTRVRSGKNGVAAAAST